jgi:hypothetical protein
VNHLKIDKISVGSVSMDSVQHIAVKALDRSYVYLRFVDADLEEIELILPKSRAKNLAEELLSSLQMQGVDIELLTES